MIFKLLEYLLLRDNLMFFTIMVNKKLIKKDFIIIFMMIKMIVIGLLVDLLLVLKILVSFHNFQI